MSKKETIKEETYNDNKMPEIPLNTLGSMALVRLGKLSIENGIEITMSTKIQQDGKFYSVELKINHEEL